MTENAHSAIHHPLTMDNGKEKKPSLWRRRLVDPLIGQLRQGATPEKLAASLAWGGLLGVFPILGTTTMLCGVAGIWLKLNHIALQTINWLVYPLQLLLIIPFLKLGNFLFGRGPLGLSLEEITAMFAADFWGSAGGLGGLAIRGIVAWAVVAVPAIWLCCLILTPILRRLASTTGIGSTTA